MIFSLYVEPILAVYLNSEFGLSNAVIGVFFLLSAVTYVIGAPLSSYLSKHMNRRYIIFFAFVLMTTQSALLGPSSLLLLPNSLVFVTIGDVLIGFCLSFALIPLLSELIELLESKGRFDPGQISDMTAALFNSMFNLGNLLSPLVAGILNDGYGYKFTTDTMMVASALYLVFLFLILRR